MEELIDPQSDDPRLISQFKTFSPLAIASFVVALISCFYLINGRLVAVPIIAIIMALVALIRIATVESLTGKWIAISAICLAAFTFTSVVTYKQLRHNYLVQTAANHADEWFEMLKDGEIYKAHQMTFECSQRMDDETDLAAYYEQPKVLKVRSKESTVYMELEIYSGLQPELGIMTDGHQCEIINEGLQDYNRKNRKENFVFQFRLKRADSSLPDQIFWMEVRRTNHLPPMGPRWACTTIENIEPKFERKIPKFPPPQ